MEFVRTVADIEANLRQLEAYLASADNDERDFARSLIRRGLCFVVADGDDGLFFGPSRFVGYRGNNRAAHFANEDKHGWDTNSAITAVLGRESGRKARRWRRPTSSSATVTESSTGTWQARNFAADIGRQAEGKFGPNLAVQRTRLRADR